jgi:hemerythrin superfamily protein
VYVPATKKRASTTRGAARAKGRSRPATSRRASSPDVIAVLKQDHRDVREMFRRFKKLGPNAQKSRQRLADQIVRALSQHAAVEEQVLYPKARTLRGGARLADHAIDEHREIKEALDTLSHLTSDDAEMAQVVRQVESRVLEHLKEEEGELFPKLRREASKEELVDMGKLTRAAKRVAPTRPHPNAPSKPPGNIVAGLAAAVVDRARDALRGARD